MERQPLSSMASTAPTHMLLGCMLLGCMLLGCMLHAAMWHLQSPSAASASALSVMTSMLCHVMLCHGAQLLGTTTSCHHLTPAWHPVNSTFATTPSLLLTPPRGPLTPAVHSSYAAGGTAPTVASGS